MSMGRFSIEDSRRHRFSRRAWGASVKGARRTGLRSCAEAEPLVCHRTILVAQELAIFRNTGRHIHSEAALEGHREAMSLSGLLGLETRICIAQERRSLPMPALFKRSGLPIKAKRSGRRHLREDFHDRIHQEVGGGLLHKLRDSGAKRLVDVRLNNVSQLAGFAKKNDLKFFFGKSAGWITCTYRCSRPPRNCWIVTRKRADGGPTYERDFLELIRFRQIESECFAGNIAEGLSALQ